MYKKQKRQDWDRKAYLMHQVLYVVQLDGDMQSDMPCDPNLVSSAFLPIDPFKIAYIYRYGTSSC